MKENKPKILVIVGPTASGKSALAIELASAIGGPASGWKGGEIVSADSRQVYVGLNIGSGKVTKREMAGVPHHMLDVASPKRVYTVSDYKRDAEKVIDEIFSRGKLPILVGGTGLYIDAVTKGLVVPEVKPNTKLRAKLEKILKTKEGVAKLYKMLAKLDKARAKNIDKHNPRRLVRAIEIATALGKVPKLVSKPRYSPMVIGVTVESAKLKANIHKRLLARMKSGMVAEVSNLHKSGLSWKRLEQLGLEYKYLAIYLQGKLTKSEMLTKLESEINHYAKRQMTWFKRDKSIQWLTSSEMRKKYPLAVSLTPSLFRRIRSLLRASAL
jgi:tRNA dimethylallyltransferase